jgi:hypothetical protein
LQQQNFGQAQQFSSTKFSKSITFSTSRSKFCRTQIAGLQTLGAGETSQQQAILEAQRQLAQQQAYQPLNVAERYGAGITPLIAGYPGRDIQTITPSPSPISNLLGIGSTLAGIYSKFNPAQTNCLVVQEK